MRLGYSLHQNHDVIAGYQNMHFSDRSCITANTFLTYTSEGDVLIRRAFSVNLQRMSGDHIFIISYDVQRFEISVNL